MLCSAINDMKTRGRRCLNVEQMWQDAAGDRCYVLVVLQCFCCYVLVLPFLLCFFVFPVFKISLVL